MKIILLIYKVTQSIFVSLLFPGVLVCRQVFLLMAAFRLKKKGGGLNIVVRFFLFFVFLPWNSTKWAQGPLKNVQVYR